MDIHRKIFIAYKKSKKFPLLLEIYKSLNIRIPHYLSHVYIKNHYNSMEDSFIRLLEKSTIQKYFRSMLSTYSKMLVSADVPRIVLILSNMCYIFEQDLVLNEIDEGRIYRIVMELTDRFFYEDTLEVSERAGVKTTDELKFWLLRLLKNIRIYFHDEREFLILKYLDNWDENDTSKLHKYLKDDLSDNLALLHKVLMQDNTYFDPEIYAMLVSLYKERIFGQDNMFNQQFFDSLVLKDNMNGKYRNLHHIKTEKEMNKPRSSCNRHIKLMMRQKFTKKMNYRILQDCIELIQKRYGLNRIPELARYSIENLRSIGENRIEEYIAENRTAIIEDLNVNKVEILAKVLRTDNFTRSIVFDLFDVKKTVKKNYNELISSASQAVSDSELKITDQTAITKEYHGIKTYQFIENIGVGNYEVVDNKKLGTVDSLPTSFGSDTSINDLNNLLLFNNVKRLAIRVDYDYGVIRKIFNIHKSVKITGVLLEGSINFDYLILLNDAVTSKILRRKSLNGLFYKLLYSELTGKSLVLKYRILGSLVQQYREMDVFIVENNLHDVEQRGIKKLSGKNGNIQKKAANDKKMYKRTDNLDINEDNTEILSVKIWDEVQVFEIEEIPYILELLIACINNTKKGFLLRRIEAKIEHYISLHSCYFYGRDMNLFFKFLESILRYDLRNKKLLSRIFDFLLEYEQEEILNVLYEHNRTFFLYLCAGIYKIDNYTTPNSIIWDDKHRKILYRVLESH
ncbi:hypothetical protein VCUG_01869 [Vavraia culicis subsp. floridensis]|uniref:Uncharacterized protein n=1 Tax=Vavraia culicis (isolate floridensis) TaxID=948595 RepID=L2GTK9_VAVCU|nr:uncharacterized protein VCUG_01869 [Vavraia culicis subsp. floridensis]ELA46643.1 hypothetical protein VCUG_01869 [Vavraia culicis subsp. floridensis]